MSKLYAVLEKLNIVKIVMFIVIKKCKILKFTNRYIKITTINFFPLSIIIIEYLFTYPHKVCLILHF